MLEVLFLNSSIQAICASFVGAWALLQFNFYRFLLSKCICECLYVSGTNTDQGRDRQKQLWADKLSPDLYLTQCPQVSDSRRGCGWDLPIQTTFSSNQSHQDFSSLDNQQEGLHTRSWHVKFICPKRYLLLVVQ